jgi:hypothetical protein
MRFLPFILFPVVRRAAVACFLFTASGLTLRADVVFAWNEALLHFSKSAAGLMPLHLEARAYAVAHLAMLEALDSLAPENGADEVPARRAAVVTAAHGVLVALLPGGTARFDALAARHLAAIPEGNGKRRGIKAGAAAAARLQHERATDGWVQVTRARLEEGPAVVDESNLARGAEAPASPWLGLRPLALKSAEQFEVAELRKVRMNGEVTFDHSLGASRLFDGLDRAAAFAARDDYWRQSPLAAWNRIARQACASRATDLRDQAQVLVRLNVALADAVLAGAHARHVVGHWRAVMAEVWQPVDLRLALPTDTVARIDDSTHLEGLRLEYGRVFIPPLAHYPAIDATLAGAAQAALAAHFTTDRVEFELPSAGDRRTFTGFAAAAREQAFVASLDGVHSREACVAGYQLGVKIGKYAARSSRVAQR